MFTRMTKYSKSLYKSQVKRGFFKAAISKAVLLMKVSVKRALTAFTHAFICSFVRSFVRSLVRSFVRSFILIQFTILFVFIYLCACDVYFFSRSL